MQVLKCGCCGQVKPLSEFTKVNRSKDGKSGLCKQCKSLRDARTEAVRRVRHERLEAFDLVPDRLSRGLLDSPRIGVLELEKYVERESVEDTPYDMLPLAGLRAILDELREPWEFTRASQVNSYDVILCSLTSVYDVINLIYTFERFAPRPVKPQVIVGGFGVVNVKLLLPYIDVAVFGRAEGQIGQILAGHELPNVWRKREAPDLKGTYVMRKPAYLLPGEQNIGCRHRCDYCFYSWARGNFVPTASYSESVGATLVQPEADWNALDLSRGNVHITAWDGWSEKTRLRVHKHITDKQICGRLEEIMDGPAGSTVLKVYMITGYPWETLESVTQDIERVKDMLASVDRPARRRVILRFKVNPFGPEPLTPMQYAPANIDTDWHDLRRDIYKGESIRAFIIPAMDSPYKLLSRVFIHRAEAEDLPAFKAMCFSNRLQRMPASLRAQWLLKHGHVRRGMFDEIDEDSAAFRYLKRDVPPPI